MATGRKTGGRQKGSLNKATAEVREEAQKYTVEALEGLAQIARTSDTDAAKVAAWKAILDRGHGRPAQELGVNLGADTSLVALMERIDGRSRGIEREDNGDG